MYSDWLHDVLINRVSYNFFSELQKAKQRPVREDQAESLVEKLRLRAYKECSAYTQDGLSDVFHEAICIALEPPPKNSNESWISKCLPCGGGRNT